MLGLVVWLLRHGYEAEKRLMITAIDDAKATAKTASDNALKQMELRHEQEIALTKLQGQYDNLDGKHKYLQADLEELKAEHAAAISKLKERLDRGQRTFSQQMERPLPREDSDPPPMRPRFKSRSNE